MLKIKKISLFKPNIWQVKSIYEAVFPAEERLPYLFLLLKYWCKLADFQAYYDRNKLVGFTYMVSDEKLSYLFFLAVDSKLQGQGYGSQILKQLREQVGDKPMLLTIEPMDDLADNYEQRLKRLVFYERNGFTLTERFYHEGQEIYQIMVTDKAEDLDMFETLIQHFFGKKLKISLT